MSELMKAERFKQQLQEAVESHLLIMTLAYQLFELTVEQSINDAELAGVDGQTIMTQTFAACQIVADGRVQRTEPFQPKGGRHGFH